MTDRGPYLARWVARVCLPTAEATRLLDTLEESYELRLRGEPPSSKDRVWYFSQVLRSLPPLLRASGRRGGSLRLDVRTTLRRLGRAPVSAVAAVGTLALSLGAAISILGVVDEVLLDPLPFERPEELVTLEVAEVERPEAIQRAVDGPTLQAWREAAAGRARLEGYDPTNVTLTGAGTVRRIDAVVTTPGFLGMLGARAARGRLFEQDDVGRDVVVVSHDFWRDLLGGEPSAVGAPLTLDGRVQTVLGILPPGFDFPLNPTEIWVPMAGAGSDGPFRVVARLSDPARSAELSAALSTVSSASGPSATIQGRSVHAAVVGSGARTLGFLSAAVAIGFLIAFTNLVVLMMVRSLDRERELAVRRALGAPRSDGRRQLVIEASALACAGLVLAYGIAWRATPAIGRYALEFSGLAHRDFSLSWPAVAAMGAVALGAAAVAGTIATSAALVSPPTELLRGGGTDGLLRLRLRRFIVAGEVAIAFVLVVVGGAIAESLVEVQSVDPGFVADGAFKAQITLPRNRYRDAESVARFYRELGARLRDQARISASLIDEVPLTGDGGRGAVRVDGGAIDHEVVLRAVAPGYFDVMGIPIRSGRDFDWTDDASNPPLVVISAALARDAFGGADPVGRALWLDGVEGPAEIVGVVGDVSHLSLEESGWPTVYRPALQAPSRSSVIVARGPTSDREQQEAIRSVIHDQDPDLPVYGVATFEAVVAASPGVPRRRLLTFALTGFAGLALLLSAIGLFGVAAHDASRRRSELALRSALGATPLQVLRVTLERDAGTVLLGLGLGGAVTLISVPVLAAWVPIGRIDGTLVGWSALLLFVVSASAVLPVGVRAAVRRSAVMDRAR